MTMQIDTADAQKKVQDYRDVIMTFSELLKEENLALNEYNVQKVGTLYERKSKLVGAYRSLVAFFMKNFQILKELDEDTRIDLREKSMELDALLKENDVLLKTRMETSKNIMDSIVRIAKITNNANSTSYGSHGNYSPLDNSKNAIAINRTL